MFIYPMIYPDPHESGRIFLSLHEVSYTLKQVHVLEEDLKLLVYRFNIAFLDDINGI